MLQIVRYGAYNIAKSKEDMPTSCSISVTAVYRDGIPTRWRSGLSVRFEVIRLGFTSPSRVILKTLENGIHSFPTWHSALRDSVENKPASLLSCPWSRHLTRRLHLYVANRWWSQAVYPSWWPSLTKNMQTKHKLIRMNE